MFGGDEPNMSEAFEILDIFETIQLAKCLIQFQMLKKFCSNFKNFKKILSKVLK